MGHNYVVKIYHQNCLLQVNHVGKVHCLKIIYILACAGACVCVYSLQMVSQCGYNFAVSEELLLLNNLYQMTNPPHSSFAK